MLIVLEVALARFGFICYVAGLRSLPEKDIPEKQGIADDIAAPHALRFFEQTVEPFQSVTLPPHRCTLHGAGEEVEHGSDSAHMTMDIEF